MSTIVEAAPTAASPSSLLHEHRPWWRSRVTLTAAVLGAMLLSWGAWILHRMVVTPFGKGR